MSGSSSRSARGRNKEVLDEADKVTARESSKESRRRKLTSPSQREGSSSRSHDRENGRTLSSDKRPSENGSKGGKIRATFTASLG